MHMVHFFLCVVQWLVYSDIEGEGTITNTLSLQKMKFPVTFTEEILQGKLDFLHSDIFINLFLKQ